MCAGACSLVRLLSSLGMVLVRLLYESTSFSRSLRDAGTRVRVRVRVRVADLGCQVGEPVLLDEVGHSIDAFGVVSGAAGLA